MAPVKGDPHTKYVEIILLLKNYREATSGDRPADSLERLAESTNIPHLYHKDPISFILIEDRALGGHYTTAQAFDQDLYRLFEKGRRVYYKVDEDNYGRVLLLQRMYHHLTSSIASRVPAMTRAAYNFSSTDSGPGRKKGKSKAHPFIQDEDPIERVTHKGQTYQCGDYVHLMNPDDARKPIVGQIFRTYSLKRDPNRQYVHVRWYLRPEQTIHPRDRRFYESEVFATDFFSEHSAEDIIEKIGLQFHERYVRGRPLRPSWYPGWPLYVCESWYNEQERSFSKIEDWVKCIPQKVQEAAKDRNSIMPILPYDSILLDSTVHPENVLSPFVIGAGKGLSRTGIGPGALSNGLPPLLTTGLGKEDPEVDHGNKTAGPTEVIVRYIPRTRGVSSKQATHHHHKRKIDDRSVIAAGGGAAYLKDAKIVALPKETVEKFDRDPKTGNLLWFSGAPIVAPDPSAYRPRYSLEYLAFLARKRKQNEQNEITTDDHLSKRAKASEDYMPTSQLLNKLIVSSDGSFSYDPPPDEGPSSEATLSLERSTESLVRSLQGKQQRCLPFCWTSELSYARRF
ncbi:uncharacterized protein EI90DRAFT_2572270 [Cantharellus anzutake]|uniref:uncharacterized protein n=1 Tax=Cantharellus anzutake TaxID=1750568 RepID=UPI0019048200|nr:uncharacterized protein EI90DRAFT_2572270 [Cantharellus anzutake]KAF8338318.1 hypothetical protein EI90DRAFT_2572270 [Cantharellus anzutake]